MSHVEFFDPELLYKLTLAIQWISFIWDYYINKRQKKIYKYTRSIRSEHKNLIKEDVFEKSRLYKLDQSSFKRFQSFFDIILITSIFMTGFFAKAWMYSRKFSEYFSSSEYLVTAVFLFALTFLQSIVSLPFSYYSNFVIEEKHGFNKQTLGFFLKDKLKSFLLILILGIPVGLICVYIIKLTGDSFVFYLSLFIFAFNLFIFYIYGEFIAPLFDKFTELPQSELRTRIEDLASSLNFPLHRLFVVEGSKRSAHSNAYVTGFFNKKKIVLYDTLIESDSCENNENDGSEETDPSQRTDTMTNDEIIAILAHELGHWKNWDVFKLFFFLQIQLLIMFNASGYFQNEPNFYKAFGFGGQDIPEMPVIVGLMLSVQFVISPLQEMLNFVMVSVSRYNELQADRFSTKLGYGVHLQSSLIKLYRKNLSFLYDDWLYAKVTYTHPPLIERLDAIIGDSKKMS